MAGSVNNTMIQNWPMVKDVIKTLDVITGGRVIVDAGSVTSGKNAFVVTKSSNIPGKAITETPGLVWGDLSSPVRNLGVSMTLTESQIELAGAIGLDGIVCHHPIADAANSGGVTLENYLSLYNIAVFELHEAFHGLHPGLAFIHGHTPFRVEIAYGGIPGNILNIGVALPEVHTAGDIVDRLLLFGGFAEEEAMLKEEQALRNVHSIMETNIAAPPTIINGNWSSPVNTILHIYPHTGFTVGHLDQILAEHPDIDTIITSISRVRLDHPLVEAAKRIGLTFILGNTHAMEIFENGMPLAMALDHLLPDVNIFLLRERVTATPVNSAGNKAIREYAKNIAAAHLLPKKNL